MYNCPPAGPGAFIRADMEVAVTRPQRWDAPFGAEMRTVDVAHLLQLAPFCEIDAAKFPPSLSLDGILRNDARLVRYADGDIVFREGDYGSSAFFIVKGCVRVVLSGLSDETLGRQTPAKLSWWETLFKLWNRPRLPEVRGYYAGSDNPSPDQSPLGTAQRGDRQRPHVFLQDVPRVLDETDTAVLEAGEFFGELAALTRSPRSATVFADGDALLLEIRWQGLRDLMRRTDALRLHIELLYRENSLRVHLRETPLLAELPPERLAAVGEATVFESHGEFDWHDAYQAAVKRRPEDAIVDEPLIAEEGEPSDGLILIRSGFARQSRRYGHGHRTTAYLGRGQVFGLAEAIESAASGVAAPWRYSLRALGYVDVLRVPREAFAGLVLPFLSPETLTAMGAGAKPANSESDQSLPYPLPWTEGDSPVGQGLLEFLVDRRLMNGREAMVIDLDRCTRCDDCVRACAATHDNNPRFVREGPRHGPIMVAHACMHCVDPVCMIGCPTGAIGRDAATGVIRINDRTCIGCGVCSESCPYDNIKLVEIRDARGAALTDAATGQPIAKATKCDLCVDLPGGPACQRACPHDALFRIDLSEPGELANWMDRFGT
jgi:Fe-S-cluster-containing dehydrogenase component/CRP-like cAMP-binding protein